MGNGRKADAKPEKKIGIERRVRAHAKRERIQDIVVHSLYAAGAVGLLMAAPNTVQLLRYVEKYVHGAPRLDRRIGQAVTRLAQKGLVRREKGRVVLTEDGERFAASLEHVRARPTQKKWDGKWRIVIFDIWERRRTVRDRLRFLLQRNGFVKVQNSVWVHPHDSEELFAFLRAHLSLGTGILYIVAEEIEHDERLRRHFSLPLRDR